MLQGFASGHLFGEQVGEAPATVLALHGWGRTHRDFAGVLGPRGEVGALDAIALDLPGFGATPPPHAPMGSAAYAAAIRPVLDEMAENVVVLGHSFGGCVAVHLAASAPERIAGLVLTGVPLVRDSATRRSPWQYRLLRAAHRRGVLADARMEAARRRFGSSDYNNADGVMRAVLVEVLGEGYEDALARIRCPVVLVWGTNDTAAPIAVGRWAAEYLHAPLREFPVGHMTPFEVPDALRDALEGLLG